MKDVQVRRRLRPSKNTMQPYKTIHFFTFWGHFCPPGSVSIRQKSLQILINTTVSNSKTIFCEAWCMSPQKWHIIFLSVVLDIYASNLTHTKESATPRIVFSGESIHFRGPPQVIYSITGSKFDKVTGTYAKPIYKNLKILGGMYL